MENAVVKTDSELVELEGIKITRGQIDLIKRTIFKDATDDEMRLFFYECRRRGVHPMDRLIYPVKRGGRVAFQMGIDYLRAAGEETGRYVGQKPMQYGPSIKQITAKDGEINVPEWAEATILRKDPETGEVVDIPHRVYWKEYYPGEELGFMWRKMPLNQLGKCAEAGGFRKAFPRKLGGLYINEEMEQAEAVPFTPIKEPQKKQPEQPQTDNAPPIVTTTIKEVTMTSGKKKDGSSWTLYAIHAGDGERYNTFSKSMSEIAKAFGEKGTKCTITFEATDKGKNLTEIKEYIEDGNAQE